MGSQIDSAVYGLIGSVIGSLATGGALVLSNWIQSKAQGNQQRAAAAAALARAEYEQEMRLAEAEDVRTKEALGFSGGSVKEIPRLVEYVVFHAAALKAIESGGDINGKIKKLTKLSKLD